MGLHWLWIEDSAARGYLENLNKNQDPNNGHPSSFCGIWIVDIFGCQLFGFLDFGGPTFDRL